MYLSKTNYRKMDRKKIYISKFSKDIQVCEGVSHQMGHEVGFYLGGCLKLPIGEFEEVQRKIAGKRF